MRNVVWTGIFLTAGFLLLLLSGCGGEKWTPKFTDIKIDPPGLAQAQECQHFKDSLPKEIKTGYVSVPENWDDPAHSSKIQVFYYGHLSDDPANPPIVFFNGGPAADSHGSFDYLKKNIASSKLNFVFVDQRGNGCSDPYPQGVSEESLKRIENYGTRAIVKDSEAIRKDVFKDHKWRAFGQSHGSHIVHRYIEVAPQGLEAAYAHGSAINKTNKVKDVMLQRLRSQKKVTDSFFDSYPEDRASWQKIRSNIPRTLCFEDGQTRICGSAVLDSAFIMLTDKNSWKILHEWIEGFSQLESSVDPDSKFVQALKVFVTVLFFRVYSTESSFAAVVLSNLEKVEDDSSEDSCETAIKTLETEGQNPENWEINECRMFAFTQRKWNAIRFKISKPDPIQLAAVHKSLLDFPNLQFFLYAGRNDIIASPESYEEELALLAGRVLYREFPDSGHEGFGTEKDVWFDLAQKF
jgi:pimeloyl-ACP methyl ester carboxylesterase